MSSSFIYKTGVLFGTRAAVQIFWYLPILLKPDTTLDLVGHVRPCVCVYSV